MTEELIAICEKCNKEIEYYPEDEHPLVNGLTGETGDDIGGYCYECLFGRTGDPEDYEER
jgi:hypothetical protein